MSTIWRSASGLEQAIPLPVDALLTTIGEAPGTRVESVAPVTVQSRNTVLRLTLEGARHASVVVKIVTAATDPFWSHHVRREHRVLEMLARWSPGLAPEPLGAIFGASWGVLISSDAGSTSLAAMLSSQARGSGGQDKREQLLRGALQGVAVFHQIARTYHTPFFRTCFAVDLDRLSSTVLTKRVRVAHQRVAAAAPVSGVRPTLTGPSLRAYLQLVLRPLLTARRQMIHNSLSPLSVVYGDSYVIVDWETMTSGVPEFDVAEFLRFPAGQLSWEATDRLAADVFGDQIDTHILRLAALSRAIDYTGATMREIGRATAASDATWRSSAIDRHRWYRQEVTLLASELHVPDVFDGLACL